MPGTWLQKRYAAKGLATSYQVGLEAVAALAIAAGAGGWLDSRLDTAPIFLLVGSALGFGSCVLRLVRHQRSQQAKGEAEDPADQT